MNMSTRKKREEVGRERERMNDFCVGDKQTQREKEREREKERKKERKKEKQNAVQALRQHESYKKQTLYLVIKSFRYLSTTFDETLSTFGQEIKTI